MMRYQFLFAITILLAISACQSDTPVNSATDIAQKAVEATDKVVKDMTSEEKDLDQAAENKAKSPKLREFYVEEDKTKVEPKKSSSEPKKDTKTSVKTDKAIVKTKAKSNKSPKLSFTNNTFAFGIIKPGEVIEHKFEFTNTGSADLVITDAKATCGCTQPSFPFVPIPPGEKGYIGVKYDSTGKLGTQKPTVTLTTNASPKTQKVFLEGVVISEIKRQ